MSIVAVLKRSMMVVEDRDLRRNFHNPRAKKFSRGIDVSGVHRVSQHLVWQCCSWLPPQRRRTRREKADHFDQPPTSRSPHLGSAAKPVGLQRRCVQERSRPRHTTTWNPPNQWNLSGPYL